jgi:hypothetical protein
MSAKELQSIVYRNPFRAFDITVSGGDIYKVKTPRDIAISKDGKMLFYFADDGTNTRIDAEFIAEITER